MHFSPQYSLRDNLLTVYLCNDLFKKRASHQGPVTATWTHGR